MSRIQHCSEQQVEQFMICAEFPHQALFAASRLRKRDMQHQRYCSLLFAMIVALLTCTELRSQTASTVALTGVTLDPSGAVLGQVTLHLTKLDGTEIMAVTSDHRGLFGFFLVPPGTYDVQATKVNFRPLGQKNIQVHVTETRRFQLR